MAITAAVDVGTGRFVSDGRAEDGVAVIRIAVSRNPDERLERYTGDPANPFRPATPQEIQSAATTDAQARAARELSTQIVVGALAEALALEVAAVTREDPVAVKQRLTAKTEELLASRPRGR